MEIYNDNDKADDTDYDEDDEINMEEAFMENQTAMTSSRSQMNDALHIRKEIGREEMTKQHNNKRNNGL